MWLENQKEVGVTDMNMVRPRISEMIDDGVLEETGKIQDHFTKKQVRCAKFVDQEF